MGDSAGDAGSAAGSGAGGPPMSDLGDAGHLPGFTPSIQSVGTLLIILADPKQPVSALSSDKTSIFVCV